MFCSATDHIKFERNIFGTFGEEDSFLNYVKIFEKFMKNWEKKIS